MECTYVRGCGPRGGREKSDNPLTVNGVTAAKGSAGVLSLGRGYYGDREFCKVKRERNINTIKPWK